MQTVILAGGMGTRIRAIAGDRPKSLIPVGGRPFIEWQLDLLRRGGIRDVLLCVGVGAEAIRGHVGDGRRFGVRVNYSVEDPSALMGTGGALANALPKLADSFLVLYGDSYLPTDYAAACAAFEKTDCPAMMCVFRNEGRWDPSNVRVGNGRVVTYDKKAPPGAADYIDYGLSAFRRSVIERYRGAPMPLDLARILSNLVARGELAAHEVAERFYEIGKPEGWEELDRLLRAQHGSPAARPPSPISTDGARASGPATHVPESPRALEGEPPASRPNARPRALEDEPPASRI